MMSCHLQQTSWDGRSKKMISASAASLEQWSISSQIATWLWTDASGDTILMDVHHRALKTSVVPLVWVEPKLQCTDSSTHQGGYDSSLSFTSVLLSWHLAFSWSPVAVPGKTWHLVLCSASKQCGWQQELPIPWQGCCRHAWIAWEFLHCLFGYLCFLVPVTSLERKSCLGRWLSSMHIMWPDHPNWDCMMKASMPGRAACQKTSWFVTRSSHQISRILKSAKAAEMELIQFLDMATVAGSCLAAVEEWCQNHTSVYSNHCFLCDATIMLHSSPVSPKGTTCLHQTAEDFFVQWDRRG